MLLPSIKIGSIELSVFVAGQVLHGDNISPWIQEPADIGPPHIVRRKGRNSRFLGPCRAHNGHRLRCQPTRDKATAFHNTVEERAGRVSTHHEPISKRCLDTRGHVDNAIFLAFTGAHGECSGHKIKVGKVKRNSLRPAESRTAQNRQ
jgi:hypothetical protein